MVTCLNSCKCMQVHIESSGGEFGETLECMWTNSHLGNDVAMRCIPCGK